MKIREDFVTNSSSSSFVIAFKDHPQLDDETLEKYPFLAPLLAEIENIIFERDDDDWYKDFDTVIFDDIEEFKNYLLKEYSWGVPSFEELLNEDSWVKSIYEKAKEYADKGYKILVKDVEYHDDLKIQIIDGLARTQGYDFVILSNDND